MRWSWHCISWLVIVALAPLACSDDGVPAVDSSPGGETQGSDETGSTPTTTSPAETSTDPTPPTGDTSSGSNGETSPGGTDDGPEVTTSSSGSESSGSESSGSESSASSSSSDDGASSSSSGDDASSSSSDDGGGVVPVGGDCNQDGDCASGICWDFSHYDQLCFGTACSVGCSTDDDCVEQLTDAGAMYPEASICGDDGRCWMVGTGFGAYACAAPVPVAKTVR